MKSPPTSLKPGGLLLTPGPPSDRRPARVRAPRGQATPSTFSQVELGERLRSARRARKMTLQALARLSGYSITHLSQVERGHACPTVGALERIALALNRDVRNFLEPLDLPEISLVRRGSREALPLSSEHERAELAAGQIPGGELRVAVHTLSPSRVSAPRSHTAEESCFLYVVRGQLEITLDEGPLICEAGTAVYLAPRATLRYRNTASEACELIFISRSAGK